MAFINPTRRNELLQMDLPNEAQTISRAREFMAVSGMTIPEFSEQIGYDDATIRQFLSRAYNNVRRQALPNESGTLLIRAAIKSYIDAHDVEEVWNPALTHIETEDYLRLRVAAFKALANHKAYVVDGPPGTQKSWCARMIERDINASGKGRCVYVYVREKQTPRDLLREICVRAGVPNRGRTDELIRKLRYFLAKQNIVLMIDEANHLSNEALEVVRQLLDEPPFFALILLGSHGLTQRLQHWTMGQWRRRVQAIIQFNGPSEEEAHALLQGQLGIVDAQLRSEILLDCLAEGSREAKQRGRKVAETFKYISADLLFSAINGVKESTAAAAQSAETNVIEMKEAVA